ncbi:VanZ family protein [Candidatus Accumulibacter cognatus]|uniref:Integral membrane protein n=1 Tax=Candidatus Accumulibacter cognatus TaxID=2954383 RepID=A0A080M5A8_9PROT|nr:VanZ family protein [Candidatus Accumulibacter cognatus]KFB76502.1 MAG: putative integral membrane protein [Candidatus Accumulibacter cognatus]
MPRVESADRRVAGPDVALTQRVLLWLAYVAFVIYGSLVPLDFRLLPFDQAWATFKQLPMLKLGVESRADWIANGVLYVPVGFLSVALFGWNKGLRARFPLLVGTACFCFALALAVEFAQLYFPPRTVSRNDVIAELIGSVVGIALAFHWSAWFRKVLAALSGNLGQLAGRALQAYAVAYLLFSLFPFDFLLSKAELVAKVQSDAWGWLFAEQGTGRGPVILIAKLTAEMLAVLPLGFILGRWNLARERPATQHAVLYGIVLGVAIETAQFFIFSGSSQGVSLLTRAIGMYGGARLWQDRISLHDLHLQPRSRKLALPLGLLYLLALVAVNGWFDHAWHGEAVASRTLAEARFLPFYYHYYTTEHAALISLVSVALMYAPIGVLAWLRWWSPAAALWVAALAATGIESSKLFLAHHPDPTNLLIGAIAAWSVSKLLQGLEQASVATRQAGLTVVTRPVIRIDEKASAGSAGHASRRACLALATILAVAAWIVIDFPFYPGLLALLLLCYAALLWFQPGLLWAAIPAAIPLLDLAPWSGRYYLDEFDFLVIVSLAVGYARVRPAPKGSCRDLPGLAVACLLALTFTVSTLYAVLPMALPDVNSFSSYYSPFNALRIARGALWALLLFALMHRFTAAGQDVRPVFAAGMGVGLAGTIAVVIWERMLFPGLLNFTDTYRVTGPFSQMHTGGADIEAYLTAALPFALLPMVQARSLAARLASGLLLLGASYAIMVTFSRAGYAGFALALIIACLLILPSRWPSAARNTARDPAPAPMQEARASGPGALRSRVYRWAAAGLLLALAAAVAVPIYSGAFAQQRISAIGHDLAARRDHWADTLAMRDPGLITALLGMGVGRFPETHYWRSSEPRATSYRLESEHGNTFLRLGTGNPLYMEQFIRIAPGEEYTLQLDIRGPQAGKGVSVSLCEKLLLTSGLCIFKTADIAEGDGQWQSQQFRLSSGELGSGGWLARRPVKLSLANASQGRVDIDNVRLLAADGTQVSHNGDFEQGLDRWFFSVDQDLPWHVWSMPVAILFDQGWLGLVAMAGLIGLGMTRTSRRAWTGDVWAGAFLAALSGVLVITLLDTLIDAPRFLLLLLLLTWVGWAGESRSARGAP